MKTIYYLLLVFIAIIISIPITIILMAIEQAISDKNKIESHLRSKQKQYEKN